MNSLSYKLKINPNLRILVVPTIVITVVVLLLFMFAPKAIPEINRKMGEYKKNHSQVEVLNEKLISLKKINTQLIDPDDTTVIALPSKNPVIWVISHIKALAEDNEVKIAEITMEKVKESGDLKVSGVSFDFSAKDYIKLLSFITNLTEILPIDSLKNVSFTRNNNRGEITFGGSTETTFYWSDFPKTLPPITEPVDELTSKDLELIGIISKYKSPSFIELEPNEPQERPQPFN